jgi:antitoxin ParD1/3/4
MQVSLNPEMQRFVEDKIRSGQYSNADAVVNDALTILRAQEARTPEDVEELRRMIVVGIAQLDEGKGADWDPEDLKRRVRERAGREKRAG